MGHVRGPLASQPVVPFPDTEPAGASHNGWLCLPLAAKQPDLQLAETPAYLWVQFAAPSCVTVPAVLHLKNLPYDVDVSRSRAATSHA